jgi:alkylation response protein AidB-like acyl-CoA dehydrogenase
MDLIFGPDETLLRDTVRRFVAQQYGFEERRRHMAEPDGFSRQMWAALADLGLLGVPLPVAAGGFGAGAVGALIVAEAFGSALVVEPYLATVVLGAGALELAGSTAQRALLPTIVAGECLLAFAHDEPEMRYDFAAVTTQAVPGPGGFALRGRKSAVLHAASADRLLVSARVAAGAGAEGLALFLVGRAAPGLTLTRYVAPDGLPAADVAFDGTPVTAEAAVGEIGAAAALIERLRDRAIAFLCAEAVGVMDALLARTIAYLGTRQQFGVPLARFQALQHRVADMAMRAEEARSMALVAALRADDPDPAQRRQYVSAAKACVGQAARFVGEQAVQLHGGIGMTDALDVSHYFKRLTTIAQSCGNADYHVDRYLEASGR